MKEIFRLLNIKETATIEEIEGAYRDMKRRLNLAGLEQGSEDWMKIARIRQMLDKAYYDLMADIIFAPANVVATGYAPLISGEPPVGKPRLPEQNPPSQGSAALEGKTPPQSPVRAEEIHRRDIDKDEPRVENVHKEEPAHAPVSRTPQPLSAQQPVSPISPASVSPPVSTTAPDPAPAIAPAAPIVVS